MSGNSSEPLRLYDTCSDLALLVEPSDRHPDELQLTEGYGFRFDLNINDAVRLRDYLTEWIGSQGVE